MIKIANSENVLAIVKRKNGVIDIYKGHNIVTNAGDEHYARLINGENSNITTGSFYLRLGIGTDNPTKNDTDVNIYIDNSSKIVKAGFPTRNYTEEGNTDGGNNVITYKIEYDVGEIIANNISEGALVDNPDNPTKALNHFLFNEAFDVTENDQLIVFINHTFVGV